MKAVNFTTFGGSEVLRIEQVNDPVIGPDEVLVRISHTSVNPVDWKIREGYLKDFLPHQFPVIPGWDASGVVEAKGKNVTDFSVGDEVYSYTRLPSVHAGTYAEKIALPSTQVALKPKKASAAQAAAIPLTALTAWQGINEVLSLKKGETILVTAGAGGVGSFAIQFARLIGATVITTASKKNHKYLSELGATHLIDYSKEDVASAVLKIAPEGVDAVFDGAGGVALKDAFSIIAKNGRLVSIVDDPTSAQGSRSDVKAAFHFVQPSADQLRSIAALVDTGKIKLPTIELGSVKDAAFFQNKNRQGHTQGKIVLAIDF